jgi:Helix-loop-helix DNA-binding domain
MSVLLQNKRNTRAEFKRLKTILPSIRRKENVSKLDIILEAIKYIDDLQDQLIDRLGGPRGDREATILALTASATTHDATRLKDVDDDEMFDDVFDHGDDEEEEEEEDLISLSDGYMSDPGLAMLYHDEDESDPDEECSSGVSNASLEL